MHVCYVELGQRCRKVGVCQLLLMMLSPYSVQTKVHGFGTALHLSRAVDSDSTLTVPNYMHCRKIFPWTPKEPWTAGHETAVAIGPKGLVVGGIIWWAVRLGLGVKTGGMQQQQHMAGSRHQDRTAVPYMSWGLGLGLGMTCCMVGSFNHGFESAPRHSRLIKQLRICPSTAGTSHHCV
jgi:hypothetical protein